MTVTHYDAIVLGVGGMGSSALYHLARGACAFSASNATTFLMKWGPHTA